MEESINTENDFVELTISNLARLAEFSIGKAIVWPPSKDNAIEMLYSNLCERIGEAKALKIWDGILYSETMEEAFALIKFEIVKSEGKSTRLTHLTLNGLNRRKVEEVLADIEKGKYTMTTKAEAKKKAPAKKAEAEKAEAKKAEAEKTESKKAPAKKGDGRNNNPGRKSKLHGKTIKPAVKENPRREGTHGHRSFAILLANPKGMKVEDYLNKGGRMNDLNWDIERDRVAVSG